MSVLTCRVKQVGVLAPGMPDWLTGRAVLRGEAPWQPVPVKPAPPQGLPANERRRTTELIRIALAVAEQALNGAVSPAALFASADGDLFIVERICEALLLPDRPVSPILFHNSVHNAPAGYLAIAHGFETPYNCISAGDGTAAAALFEAVTQVVAEARDVLLVLYDCPTPPALHAKRPLSDAFGAALWLAPESATGPRLSLAWSSERPDETPCRQADLEALRQGNPAARILPILAALAGEPTANVVLGLDKETGVNIGIRP